MITHNDPQAAFQKAIDTGRLTRNKDSALYVGHWMYMGTDVENVDLFKHKINRSYLSRHSNIKKKEKPTTKKEKPTTLYRAYDAAHNLLYVGISHSLMQRLYQHKGASVWHGDCATINLEHFKTRSAALKAEAEAIKKENPLYNKQGKPIGEQPVHITYYVNLEYWGNNNASCVDIN